MRTLFTLLLMTSFAQAQDVAQRLHDAHDTFQEKTLTHRRFKHTDLIPLLKQLNAPLSVSQVGESTEKRAIYQVKAGTGPTPVLLWSQMHGDEATATMALFDIFNFLQAKDDGLDTVRQQILSKTTLYAIPMLNPDGAERFQRRTSLDIDLNRDALRLQSPEAVLLKSLQQTLKPLVGFNLHDQNPRYSVGKTGKQATVSFLATAYDEARSLNAVRKRSMQLIVGMNRVLQQFIPGHVARYDDEFEPRAFGDNIQKWGTTLILIESGGWAGDPEKQYIRKLNFVAILTALSAIADGSYQQEPIADYQAIPENGRTLYDLIIRNATVQRQGKAYRMDVAINHYETNQDSARQFAYRSVIEDIGDLSTFQGINELDANGLQLVPARQHSDTLTSVAELSRLNLEQLRNEGIVGFKIRQGKRDRLPTQPVHLLRDGKLPQRPPGLGQIPTFLLRQGNQLRYVFINGFGQEIDNQELTLKNGIID